LADVACREADPNEVQTNRSYHYPGHEELLAPQNHVFPVFEQHQPQNKTQRLTPTQDVYYRREESQNRCENDSCDDNPLDFLLGYLMRKLLPDSPQILQILILLLLLRSPILSIHQLLLLTLDLRLNPIHLDQTQITSLSKMILNSQYPLTTLFLVTSTLTMLTLLRLLAPNWLTLSRSAIG